MTIELNPIANPEQVGGFNTNFQLIEDYINDNLLNRNGLSSGEPNHIEVDLDLNGNSLLNVSTDLANENSLVILKDADLRYIRKAGDTLSGILNMGANRLTNLPSPVSSDEAARKGYVDTQDAGKVSKSGDSMTGPLSVQPAVGGDEPARKDELDTERGQRVSADDNLQSQISGGSPLEASAFSPISWHAQSIANSVTIPDNKNAWSIGPEMSVEAGQTVTVGTNSFWTIVEGNLV